MAMRQAEFGHEPVLVDQDVDDPLRARQAFFAAATHDLKMVDVSDRVVWIRDGEIAKIEERADIDISVGEMEGEHLLA